MQLIGPLFSSLIGGGAAAGAAGGAASGLSGLQLASGVLGAIGEIGAGVAANREARAQAAEEEFAARDEFIQSKQTSAALKDELARTVANQTVAFAASGVDLGSVSVEQARGEAIRDAEKELGSSSNEALSRSLARRRRARGIRDRGRNAVFSGLIGGAQSLVNAGLDMKTRGA